MTAPGPLNLSLAFQSVRDDLLPQQEALNRGDFERGKHGDDMVALFTVLAADDQPLSPQTNISIVFDRAATRAAGIMDNPSAQFYAQGLTHFAAALRDLNITLLDLGPYLQSVLADTPQAPVDSGRVSQGQLVKALIKGLSAWDTQVSGQERSPGLLSMGYLFDLGIAYLQARHQNASKLDAVVAVSVQHSPLKAPEFRAASGTLVIKSLLEAILRQVENPGLPAT